MPRTRSTTLAWSLDASTDRNIADARIALALMQSVRRVKGVYPRRNCDDLGAAIAPALVPHLRLVRTCIAAHQRSRTNTLELDEPLSLKGDLLQDATVQTFLAESFVRCAPRFKTLFDRAIDGLADFVAAHSISADRNIDMLARLLSIPAPATRLLRLAASVSAGSLERTLFSFVSSRAQILTALEALCEVSATGAAEMLRADGALVRCGLLDALVRRRSQFELDDLLMLSEVAQSLLAAPFETEAQMAGAVLKPLACPAQALQWPHLAKQTALLKALVSEAVANGERGVNILVYGPPGTGKTQFVQQLLTEVGATGYAVGDADDDGGEANRAERLANLQLNQIFAGRLSRSVLVLDEAEDIFQSNRNHPLAGLFRTSNESKSWVNKLLEENPHPVIWISNRITQLDPAYLRRFSYCLEFPRTPSRVRRLIARDRLEAVGCSPALIEAVSGVDELEPAHLDTAARLATLCRSGGIGADEAVRSAIDSQLRAAGHAPRPLGSGAAKRFDTRYLNLDGPAQQPDRVLDALKRLAPSAPVTMLFAGPPGTGKTQFASEIAERLDRKLLVRTASDINSKWYGESEANVAAMFRDCDPHSELLFLDEAEVLLGSRERAAHRADQAVTAEFLRWLEAFEGTFICATNHATAFDAALMRRFTFRLNFRPLNVLQRSELFAEMALGWRPDGSAGPLPLERIPNQALVDLERLTPGDFANAARRIRMLGLSQDAWIAELTQEHSAKGATSGARIGFI